MYKQVYVYIYKILLILMKYLCCRECQRDSKVEVGIGIVCIDLQIILYRSEYGIYQEYVYGYKRIFYVCK